MELSIIYVNWNSLDYLRSSIASVYEFTRATTFEIVVVDNASPEGGIDSIRNSFPEAMVIKSDKNLGFAGANNLGFQNSHGEYILLLNPDTKLFEPSIDVMMGYIKQLPDAGIVGCKLLNTDLSVQLSSIQKFPTILNQVVDAEYLRHRWPHSPLWGIAPLFEKNITSIPVEVIPGACMLLRRKVFEEVGCYSEDYFMYAEDVDLCYQTRKAGWRVCYTGEATVVHHGGGTSKPRKGNDWVAIMQRQAILKFCRMAHGSTYATAYRAAMGFNAACRLIILAALFPLQRMAAEKRIVHSTSAKWLSVLKWAVGLDRRAAKLHGNA